MHSIHWVHGDMKPDNIMITRTPAGAIKATLIDFDLAQKADSEPKRSLGVDQYKRESWVLGATIYSALFHKPPYGYSFDFKTKEFVSWSKEAMTARMLELANSFAWCLGRQAKGEGQSTLRRQ
ncbi:hypothetical protein THASP1DRAFT_26055 [Thamnocephalis sphaerospora]|uniref:Protein kinase domain-containing protein n=1 Tax=Thamnocephalis sphaerospora TaxID=78915 RepID=A0A4P9XJC1_9FUNG|nr:hypothetical protein THASP1DRAFT_26055 [Thamnocephalis sphaerospora]|eukprot:RKP05451.1 hypothetical protein THASP1DRAFT_26055 [Thamnocephalis sphaerospora]